MHHTFAHARADSDMNIIICRSRLDDFIHQELMLLALLTCISLPYFCLQLTAGMFLRKSPYLQLTAGTLRRIVWGWPNPNSTPRRN